MGERIVRSSNSLLALQGLGDNQLGVCRSPEPQQNGREHAVGRSADTLTCHCPFSEYEGVCEASGAHQAVCLDIRRRR